MSRLFFILRRPYNNFYNTHIIGRILLPLRFYCGVSVVTNIVHKFNIYVDQIIISVREFSRFPLDYNISLYAERIPKKHTIIIVRFKMRNNIVYSYVQMWLFWQDPQNVNKYKNLSNYSRGYHRNNYDRICVLT